MHLHHRLLSIGHSHRRAVLVMYFWAALLSFGAVALSITGGRAELLIAIGVLLVVGVVVVLSPRARRAAREARAAELARPARAQPGRPPHAPRGAPSPRRRPGPGPRNDRPHARYPVTARHRGPRPWDLSFLRVGRTVAAAVTAVAAPVDRPARWAGPDAVGVLVGAVIVTAFFCVSGVVVAWAGRIADTFTLPAALGTFFVKALVLFAAAQRAARARLAGPA